MNPAPQPHAVQVGGAGSQLLDGLRPRVHQLADTAAQGKEVGLEILLFQLIGKLCECLIVHPHLVGRKALQSFILIFFTENKAIY